MLKETQRWPYASAHRQTPRSPSVSAQHGERWCTNWPGGVGTGEKLFAEYGNGCK